MTVQPLQATAMIGAFVAAMAALHYVATKLVAFGGLGAAVGFALVCLAVAKRLEDR
jgi:hypothetical protein